MSRAIYWFRNDLRLSDNEGLNRAIASMEEVIPVYVLNSGWLHGKQHGIERMGVRRLKFLLESLTDLQRQLRKTGSDLYFAVGQPVEVLTDIAQKYGCDGLYGQAACAHEEVQQESALQELMPCNFTWGETLYHLKDLPFALHELPDVYTQFRKVVEKNTLVRALEEAPTAIRSPKGICTAIPSLEELGFEPPAADSRSVLQFKGGSKAAEERLQYYLWDKELLSNYKNTRNGLIGGDYSSKFSPWLAQGCISPRQIYWQVKKFEKYVKKNSSTYWLIFELIWRDYFHFVAKKYGPALYRRAGLAKEEKIEWGSDKLFHLWTSGRTKEPFVDANMREMNATGFMSNRGRQVVASYLMHQMKIDWRLGAAYFEKMLIDYDPCSNYGNWTYIAGVGNDPRGGREFNIERQKENYDPKGEYQELWS